MKIKFLFIISFIEVFVFFSCEQRGIKYELYSNGKLAYEILPEDIEFYDTTQERNGIEIHELRLKESFYKKDSLILVYPMYLNCVIKGKKYFWSEYFRASQSLPELWVNFHFRSSCENWWTFPEAMVDSSHFQYLLLGDTLILHTDNKCNSIEFFNMRNHVSNSINEYKKLEYFRDYVDTARLAHEILYDPYYLDALKENGVDIR